jgi:hypothetical protein
MSKHTTNDPQSTVEYGYCHCGCGQKTSIAQRNRKSMGWIKGEPIRFVRGHHDNGCRRPLEDRFLENSNKSGPVHFAINTRCWLWTGHRGSNGYGRIKVSGKVQMAHRMAWEIENGSIPEGLCVLHRCDNPSCVRPDHLFLGTHRDNAIDREMKGRGSKQRGEERGSAKLTNQDIPRIRELCDNGVTQRAAARIYGVAQSTIGEIVRREKWSHVK